MGVLSKMFNSLVGIGIVNKIFNLYGSKVVMAVLHCVDTQQLLLDRQILCSH